MKNPLVGLLVVLIVGLTAIVSVGIYKNNKVTEISSNPTPIVNSVPLPSQEDIIRTFFELINEKRIPEAINMMTKENNTDDSVKQAWGVMFNAFKLITVTSIEAASENFYKVNLIIEMNEDAASVKPIPYYGFGNGQFTRWIGLEKEDNLWKISGIASGP
jgi:hypothetical protein